MRKMVAVLVVVGLAAGMAMAADAAATLKGKIVKVDGANVTVSTKVDGEKKDVVVATDDNTKVTIDGVDGKKVSDLKENMRVTVTPATGTATKIEAKTPKPKAPKA